MVEEQYPPLTTSTQFAFTLEVQILSTMSDEMP